jgi:hypothetical protein
MTLSTPALVAHNIPWAGLGNRVRFTLSAQVIAERERRAFYYSWPVGPAFGAAFTDLWDYRAAEVPADVEPPTLTEKDDLTLLRDKQTWSVRSASPLRENGADVPWGDVLARLTPAPELAHRIDDFRREHLPGRYVGVQVRANEKTHAKTLEASPVSWFTGRMREILDADPRARFFLSCDEPGAQEQILSEFPSAVALHDKGGYNSREGIRASVVDLHLLAGATHLLGPYWSSFVDLAWIMSGKAINLETSQRTNKAQTAVPSA